MSVGGVALCTRVSASRQMTSACLGVLGVQLLAIACGTVSPATETTTQQRIDDDLAHGKPIVAHVVVALCDNVHQGIVPVPAHLGNGQDPRSNLYWGALYGVRTHLVRGAGWARVSSPAPPDPRILERLVLTKHVERNGQRVTLHLVADAWDGRYIRDAIDRFLQISAGHAAEVVDAGSQRLQIGGSAHLVAYMGHNGLMDFDLRTPGANPHARARDAIVLACASKSYFVDKLHAAGAHPLLLTTGLMAPEAYTLDAALRAWLGGRSPGVTESAARAYNRYQKCGLSAARRLFWSDLTN